MARYDLKNSSDLSAIAKSMERIEAGQENDAADKPANKAVPVATGKAILIGALLGLVLAGGIIAFFKFVKITAPMRAVPDVMGQPESSAKSLVTAAKLRPVVEYDPSSKKPSGTVIKVKPPESAKVKDGSTVTIVVAGKGPKVPPRSGTKPPPDPGHRPPPPSHTTLVTPAAAKVGVPDVVETTEAKAKSLLQQAGLVAVVQPGQPSAQAGVVTAVNPAVGTQVEKGSAITLTVSTALAAEKPTTIKLTNYVGTVGKDAVTDLRRQGLVAKWEYKSTKIQPENYVLETKPAANTVLQPGSEVVLVLAKP
jgi:hypothetical protein